MMTPDAEAHINAEIGKIRAMQTIRNERQLGPARRPVSQAVYHADIPAYYGTGLQA